MKGYTAFVLFVACAGCAIAETVVDAQGDSFVLQAGHPSLRKWLLPEQVPSPPDNRLTPERAELGKKLFFDPRLSGTGQSTCASCHLPERGWSDGFPKSIRFMGNVMTRASPSLVNVGYNSIFQWDGRSPTLEHQAVNGISATGSMNAAGKAKATDGIGKIQKIAAYAELFASAYPGEGVTATSIGKALASFERTIVSRDSPFDRWIRGDASALSAEEVRGFSVFVDPAKGNCAVCHSAPNFTDDGFHNLGLKSFAEKDSDPGRFGQRAVALMRGAFKTPGLRDVAQTAPYFHDGSADTLEQVVEHYVEGGAVKTNLSPPMKPLSLSAEEKAALAAFLRALTTPHAVFDYPVLPK
jgi:cytochrome c peroxidase